MRLVRADADSLDFTERLRVGPTALSACLVAALGLLPLFAPTPLDAPRIATVLVLALLALLLTRVAIAPRRRVRVDLQRKTISTGTADLPFERVTSIVLHASDPVSDEGLRPQYR